MIYANPNTEGSLVTLKNNIKTLLVGNGLHQ